MAPSAIWVLHGRQTHRAQKGGDISPIKHSPQDDQCGPGVERTDVGRAVEEYFQDDPHDPDAASSGTQRVQATHEDTSSAPVVSVRDPGSASQSEIDENDKTHLPYRSWCPVCVKSRGR